MAKQGFASLSKDALKKVTSAGGRKVSKNKKHMSAIGRKGGIKSSQTGMSMSERAKLARQKDREKGRWS